MDYQVVTDFELVEMKKEGGWAIANYSGSGLPDYVKIPCEIEGKKIIGIKRNAFEKAQLSGMILPETLLSIEKGAFEGARIYLVIIPQNCKVKLCDGAFSNRYTALGISKLCIPASVTDIGDIFYGTKSEMHTHFRYKRDEDGKIVRNLWGDEIRDDYTTYEEEENRNTNAMICCEAGSAAEKFAQTYDYVWNNDYEYEVNFIQYTKDEILTYSNHDKYLQETFSFMSGATTVTISKNIKVIQRATSSAGDSAFIKFEEGSKLEILEKDAFYYSCNNRSREYTIKFPPSLKIIRAGAFGNQPNITIYIPNTCKVEENVGLDKANIIYYDPETENPQKTDTSKSESVVDKVISLFKKILN